MKIKNILGGLGVKRVFDLSLLNRMQINELLCPQPECYNDWHRVIREIQ